MKKVLILTYIIYAKVRLVKGWSCVHRDEIDFIQYIISSCIFIYSIYYIRDVYIYFLIVLTIVFARLDFFTVVFCDFPVGVYMSTLTLAILQ